MSKHTMKDFSIRKLDFSSHNVKFLSKFRIWFAIPLVIVLVAIIVFSIFTVVGKSAQEGMNLGIDFTGGTVMTVVVGNELDDQAKYDEYSKEFRKMIENEGFSVSYVQKSGNGADAAVLLKYQNSTADIEQSNQNVKDAIATKYHNITVDDISLESISASSAQDLLKKAVISLVVIFAVMLVYIGIRFELWSGLSALCALIHDVIMMVAFTIIFHIEVNTTYVAAVITIVAYSINNTIVVFDRLRENMRLAPKIGKVPLEEYTEEAVNSTFTRSAVSTITTIIPVLLLGCFGVTSLKQFAWPIMFGLIAGTYSSLILAPTIYVMIRRAIIDYKNKKNNTVTYDKPSKKQKDELSDVLSQRKRTNA